MTEDEEKCCGNGCNNCVLDRKCSAKDASLKDTVFERGYQWFTVTGIKQETKLVFRVDFQFPSVDKRCLFIPPGAHLMLRLPREYIREDTNEV